MIEISRKLNNWLQGNFVLKSDDWYDRIDGRIYQELSQIRYKDELNDPMVDICHAIDSYSSERTAHLWLLLNSDKYKVKEDDLYYFAVPDKKEQFFYFQHGIGWWSSNKKTKDELKGKDFAWTLEEIEQDDVARNLPKVLRHEL